MNINYFLIKFTNIYKNEKRSKKKENITDKWIWKYGNIGIGIIKRKRKRIKLKNKKSRKLKNKNLTILLC
jgi:hypothetical protein